MDRRKCDILIFSFSIPFPFTLFKGWWSDFHSNWSSEVYPYLLLFTALAEIYFSRRQFVNAGLIGMGIFVAGVFLHILRWPGAQLFTFGGIAFFIAIPLWSALATPVRSSLRIIVSIWVLIYGAGVIFKIFHWPAAGLLVILSIAYIPVMATALGINLWRSRQQHESNV